MTYLDRVLSPREMRERLEAQRRVMQAAVATAGAEMLEHQRQCVAVSIDRYRSSLPQHRRGWFDTLSIDDQKRLALYQPDTRTDIQRDYDEEREHGWSVS